MPLITSTQKPSTGQTLQSESEKKQSPLVGRNVRTELNYYRDPGDGSGPIPVVVGRYDRSCLKITKTRQTGPN